MLPGCGTVISERDCPLVTSTGSSLGPSVAESPAYGVTLIVSDPGLSLISTAACSPDKRSCDSETPCRPL